jgi:hypothetical protein
MRWMLVSFLGAGSGAGAASPLGLQNLLVGDAKALADDLALGVLHAVHLLAAPALYGRLKGLLAHDGAVHLLPGQAAQGGGDVLVGDLERLVHGLALHQLGQRGAGGDGAGAAEGLEAGVLDDAVLDLEEKLQGVAAGDGADLAHAGGVLHLADVLRIQEMFLHDFRVFPHGASPKNAELARAKGGRIDLKYTHLVEAQGAGPKLYAFSRD